MIRTCLITVFLFAAISLHTSAQPPDTTLFDYGLSVTEHEINVDGTNIEYEATAGYMPIQNESGKTEANMFFIAYTKKNVDDHSARPLTFSFNGGPGSSSVWLHLGALGPKRVKMTEKGASVPPPYELVDNEYTWLDKTDLVFIDPVMTGYSRPAGDVEKEAFTGFENDIESVGEFIRLYTTKYERWDSPKYLAGESYGTTRAAGLSEYLQDRYGMYLNGIALVSAILNFQTARFDRGNDLPYLLFLPTYAATAWYHDQLDDPYRGMELKAFLDEVEQFAMDDYARALLEGDRLTESKKNQVAEQLSDYTGLSVDYILETRLRIHISRFTKELRRDEGITVGRLDSRFTGVDYDDAGEYYEYDPSYSRTIYGPYTAMLNEYVRTDLEYRNNLPYEILTGRVRPWSYSNVENEYLNVAESLRSAMSKNPHLNVWVAAGYYDLATPYFAAEYTINHMMLDSTLRNNIWITHYRAGHMMYIHKPSLERFKEDYSNFMDVRR